MKEGVLHFLNPAKDYSELKNRITYDLDMQQLYVMKIFSIAVLVVILIFGWIDFVLVEQKQVYQQLNLVRFVLVLGALVPLSVYYVKAKRPVAGWVIALNLLIYSAYLLISSYIIRDNQQALFHNSIGFVLFTIFLFLLTRLNYYRLLLLLVNLLGININLHRAMTLDVLPITYFDVNFWILMVTLVSFLLGKQLEFVKIKSLIVSYRLEKASQFRYKMFGVISHDLKNLTALQYSIINYLSESGKSIHAREQSKFLKMLEVSAKESIKTFEDTLLWMKTQLNLIKPINETVQLTEFTHKQIGHFIFAAKNKRVSFSTTITGNDTVVSDVNILGLALRNVIGNAIKYSKPDTQVVIDVLNQQNKLKIAVKDQGVGMTEKEVFRLLNSDYAYRNRVPMANWVRVWGCF